MFIDTHCHLNFPEFDGEATAVLMRAKEAHVERVVNVGIDLPTSKRSLDFARRFPEVYASVGLHPHTSMDLSIEVLNDLSALADHERVVAIGEIGLDYYFLKRSSRYSNYPSRQQQMFCFEQMLDLSLEKQKPVIIHSRESDADVLAILKGFSGAIKGVVHCFSGSYEYAEKILDLGLLISFTGNITFKNAEDLRQVVKKVPLESLMIETDSPYLAPEPYRGKRNEPAYVVEVAKKIAEVKGVSLAEVEGAATSNARELFGI